MYMKLKERGVSKELATAELSNVFYFVHLCETFLWQRLYWKERLIKTKHELVLACLLKSVKTFK